MIQTTIQGKTYGFEDLPEGSDRFKVFNDEQPYLSYFKKTETGRIYLPKGNWQYIACSKDITEEQLDAIVESFYSKIDDPEVEMRYYKDYHDGESFGTRIESFHSLLLSLGLSTEKNYAILQLI